MHCALQDDQDKKHSEDSGSWFFLIIKHSVNVAIAIFISSPCTPVNHGKKHIDGCENMRINKMQKANWDIADCYFNQHEDRCQDVLIYTHAVDLLTRSVHCWPVSDGHHQAVDTCYGEDYPRYLGPKWQIVVFIFGFNVRLFLGFVAFVFRRQSYDVSFGLEAARSVARRIVFDPRTAAVVCGDEHCQQEMSGYDSEDPVAEVNEPIAAVIEATVD